MNLAKIYGKNLRSARKKAGMTQGDLAGLLGESVEQNSVSRYENGKTLPGDERKLQIAEILGRPLWWFFREDELGGADVAREKPSVWNKEGSVIDHGWRLRRELREARKAQEKLNGHLDRIEQILGG